MSADAQVMTKDEFYETIRAPMFYDFCSTESSERLDCFFENTPYPDSSEESEEKDFTCGSLLQDEEFDAKTPPKPVSRTKLAAASKKKTPIRSVKKSVARKTKLEGRRASMAGKRKASIRKMADRQRPSARNAVQRPSVQAKSNKLAVKPSVRPSLRAVATKSTLKTPAAPTKSARPSTVVRPSVSRSTIKPAPVVKEEQFVFRARPLDRRVFASCGDRGVPKLAKLPLTRPVSPKLATNHRQRKQVRVKTTSKLTSTSRTEPVSTSATASTAAKPATVKSTVAKVKKVTRPVVKTLPVKSQSAASQVVAKKVAVSKPQRPKSMENQENENASSQRKAMRARLPKRGALTARS